MEAYMMTGISMLTLAFVNFWGLLIWHGLEKIHQELSDNNGGNLERQADKSAERESDQIAPRD